MATIVCHGGFQPYLESQLVESRIHRFMLPSPKPLQQPFKSCLWESNTKPHCDENSYKTNTTVPNQGWSSIQDLSSASAPKESLSTSRYVHPEVKQSLVRLSPKSLELCTENLGNETGSDMIESDIELFSSSSECDEPEANWGMREHRTRKTREARNFPPPLTSIRGSESIRVRGHREGGRLVLQVTKVNVPSCFQAERSPGRLRLCFWTDEIQHDVDEIDQEEFQSESNEEDEVDENEQASSHEYIRGCNSWSAVMVEEKYERAHTHRRRSRCKECEHENNELLIINWVEPLWVATS